MAIVMQCTLLPVKVCDKLDALNINFLWGSIEAKHKLHMVSWKKVTQPKSLGGLRLHAIRVRNNVSMAKLIWRVSKNVDGLWANVLRNKFFKKLMRNVGKQELRSRTWKGLKKGCLFS